MKVKLIKIALILGLIIPVTSRQKTTQPDFSALDEQINLWHKAATNTDADAYFGMMAPNSVFIGTDKTENWNKQTFESKYRPYFEAGKSWDFKPISRHWYSNRDGQLAWFDETLDTWMGVCQASGVMEKQNDGRWMLKHYQLSLAIDNDKMDKVMEVIR